MALQLVSDRQGRVPHPLTSAVHVAIREVDHFCVGAQPVAFQDGAPTVRIHGRHISVRAAVQSISGLSGHADRSELLRWLAPLAPPWRTFMTHDEKSSALAETLRADRGWEAIVPSFGQRFVLGG